MPTYLLYGEDTFSSKRKLEEIKWRFFEAQKGDLNITTLEGENLTFPEIKKTASLIPLLGSKRLIIIKNFLKKGQKEEIKQFSQSLDKIPPFSIVLLYEEGEIDKSQPLFRRLKSEKRVEEFPLLSQEKLREFILKEVKEKGGKIEKEAAEKLAQITGPDLFRLSLEIDKLISYKKGQLIKKEDLEALVKEEIHPDIFTLIDALGEKKSKKALSLLSELLSKGENENYILSMIAYQFRNLLIVKDLLENGKPLSFSGLHPFVLEKTKSQVKNFTQTQLLEIYEKILETDFYIKTGSLKPGLALDLLISELSQ